MDNSFIGFVEDIFNYLRGLPLLNEHYDKLIVVLGALLLFLFRRRDGQKCSHRSGACFLALGLPLSGHRRFPARQSVHRRSL